MGDAPRRYAAPGIEISYDARRCIHAAECVRGLPAVFDPARRPWIMADAAPADEIAAVVARCPSGALHATRRDGGPEEDPPVPPVVRVIPDGPLYVHGRALLLRTDGPPIAAETRLALCRCGQSRNKPFCDNSHREAGFADDGAVAFGGDAARTGEPLTITALADGSLQLRGAFTLLGADGGAHAAGRAALCRCGGSGAKPLCDGTHRRIGFRGEGVANGER